jgi:hypothetical protein
VEWSVPAKCIDQVDGLLALDLAGDSGNDVLEVEYYLEDLDVLLASLVSTSFFRSRRLELT